MVTYFEDTDGNALGDDDELLAIPLYKGMHVTINGHEGKIFEVVDWNYHHGYPHEKAGLRIILK